MAAHDKAQGETNTKRFILHLERLRPWSRIDRDHTFYLLKDATIQEHFPKNVEEAELNKEDHQAFFLIDVPTWEGGALTNIFLN